MAKLLCESNINFNSSSWKVIDNTSYTGTEASFGITQNIYRSSQNFAPGAITVEGILVKLWCILTNSGTLSVELYNASAAASVAGTEVTTNVSSLPQQLIQNNNSGGWIYMKFSSPVTLLAATNYNVRIKTSGGSTLYFFKTATANDWSRGLVTSTTAAPAATDNLICAAGYTGTSAPSYITCTMNNTVNDVYGSIELGAYSKMILENSASTNYVLKIATGGNYTAALNSVTEFGTLATPLQSTSTFLLELQSSGVAANQLIIRNLASFTACGTSKTRKAKLAANSSVGATSLTTNISTGWKNGDNLVFGSTTRGGGASGTERKALTADASGTTLTITAMTLAKLGTSPIQCDIGNVTSNLKIYGTSTTSTFAVNSIGIDSGSTAVAPVTAVFDNVEFRYIGGNTGYKWGIELRGSTGSTLSITNCGFHDCHASSRLMIINQSNTNMSFGLNIDGNVVYGSDYGVIFYNSQSNSTQKVSNNLFIGQTNTSIFFGASGTMTGSYECYNNTMSGCFYGIQAGLIDSSALSGNTASAMTLYGFNAVSRFIRSTVTNFTVYLCNGYGMNLQDSYDCIYDTAILFANGATANLYVGSTMNTMIKNYNIQSYSGSTSAYSLYVGSMTKDVFFDNCSFGTTTVATTSNMYIESAFCNLVFRNSTLGNSTFATYATNALISDSKIAVQRNAGTAGVNRVYKSSGTIFNDTVIYDTSPSSVRLTPASATVKLRGTYFQIAVASGSTATFSIKVRKSVVGDGTAYNGNQPRLILRANPSAHTSAYNSDIVCATASAAAGSWETLSYTLPNAVTDNVGMEFYVDCDGTTGWVNIDTITVT